MSDADRTVTAHTVKIVERPIRSEAAASAGSGAAGASAGGLAGWVAKDLHPASLMAIGVGAAAILAAGWVWSTDSARLRREEQLLYAGGEIADAIASYYAAAPRHVHELPRNLRELVDDNRDGTHLHHLTAIPDDPLTGQRDWVVIRGADGGIAGVHSASADSPTGRVRLPAEYRAFAGRARYAEWVFRGEIPGEPVMAGVDPALAPDRAATAAMSSEGRPSEAHDTSRAALPVAIVSVPRHESVRVRSAGSRAGARATKVHARTLSFARHAQAPRGPSMARSGQGGPIPIDTVPVGPRAVASPSHDVAYASPVAAFAKLPTVVVPPPIAVREPANLPPIPPARRRAGAGIQAEAPLRLAAIPEGAAVSGGTAPTPGTARSAPAGPPTSGVAISAEPAAPPPRKGDMRPAPAAALDHAIVGAASTTSCAKPGGEGTGACASVHATGGPLHDPAAGARDDMAMPTAGGPSSPAGSVAVIPQPPRILVEDGPDGVLVLSYYGPVTASRTDARKEESDTPADPGSAMVSATAAGGKGKRALGERGLGRDSGVTTPTPAPIQLASAGDDTGTDNPAPVNPNPLSELQNEPDRAKRYCMMLAITDAQACDALAARGAEQAAGVCRITAEGRQLACLRGEKIGQLSSQ